MRLLRVPTAALAALLAAPVVAQDPAPAAGEKPAAPAKPADDTPVARLPEVVVTPTRGARDPFDVPAAARTLDADDAFTRRAARTVPEALAQVAGIGVQKTSQGQGTVFLRGFTGFRTLLLYDGMRLNNSIMREGPNEYLALVDPSHLGRLEIVDGPGSVLYGSDAIGGSVNLLPRAPERTGRSGPDGDRGWSRRLAYRYGGADQSHTARGEVTGWTGPLALRVGGTWRDFHDVEGGRHVGVQPRTGYEARGGDATGTWTLGEHARVRANVFHTISDDAWRTHATTSGIAWHGTTVGSDIARVLDHERTFGTLHLDVDRVGVVRDVRVSLAAGRLLETQDRTRSSGVRNLNQMRVNTGAGAFQLGLPLGIEGARLLVGADWFHDDVDAGRQDFSASTGLLTSTKVQGVVADDARYDLLGAFVHAEVPLGRGFEAAAGARFTWADVYAGAVQDPVTGLEISLDDSWSNVSGASSLAWNPSASVRLFTSLAQSFRAPNLSDLTRLDEALSGELEIPSLDLDPEHYVTWEAGLKTRQGPLEFEAVYFYTWITDMIVRTPTGNIVAGAIEVRKSNVGDGYAQGASGTLAYHFDSGLLLGWQLSGGASWQQGAVDTFPTSAPVKEREPISQMRPASGFVRLGFESPDGLWRVEAEARFARAQERLSSADNRNTQRIPPGGTPGWATFALRGGVRLAERLTVDVGLENLGDRDYRYHGSGVNEPGAHAVLQVGWEF